MKQINLGRIVPKWTGTWDVDTTYNKLDIAYYSGDSWASIVDDNEGETPSTASTKWTLAAKGLRYSDLTSAEKTNISDFVLSQVDQHQFNSLNSDDANFRYTDTDTLSASSIYLEGVNIKTTLNNISANTAIAVSNANSALTRANDAYTYASNIEENSLPYMQGDIDKISANTQGVVFNAEEETQFDNVGRFKDVVYFEQNIEGGDAVFTSITSDEISTSSIAADDADLTNVSAKTLTISGYNMNDLYIRSSGLIVKLNGTNGTAFTLNHIIKGEKLYITRIDGEEWDVEIKIKETPTSTSYIINEEMTTTIGEISEVQTVPDTYMNVTVQLTSEDSLDLHYVMLILK